jgi:hypothetical protein
MDIEGSSESNFERSSDFSFVLHLKLNPQRPQQLCGLRFAATGKTYVFRKVLCTTDAEPDAKGTRIRAKGDSDSREKGQ